eukprot:725641-Amphidinium_carterae.1
MYTNLEDVACWTGATLACVPEKQFRHDLRLQELLTRMHSVLQASLPRRSTRTLACHPWSTGDFLGLSL